MNKIVKVKIGFREYSLSSDNEAMVVASTERVNEQLELLKNNLGSMPEETLAILAALNIAENDIKNEETMTKSISYLQNEISNMSNLLKDVLD
jgi:cell division protein ZapA (FtsZ GTPase activity inhibitor)